MTTTSVWGASGGSAVIDNASAVCLGTKIRSHATTQLWAIGIRYYRQSLNGASKTARIFKTSDQSVVSEVVTFVDSGTGWQEAYFVTPVALDLNTSYTPGVVFPNGEPPYTSGYFTSGGGGASGVSSTPPFLFAPNNSDALGQGVYVGGSSLVCPTNSFNSTCYWIDIIVTDVDPNAKQGTGSLAVGVSVSGSGTPRRAGTGLLATQLGITATGTPRRSGTADMATGLTVTGTGTPKRGGTASIPTGLSVSGTGTPKRGGDGAVGLELTVTGTGTPRRSGTATITLNLAVTGAGRIPGQTVGIIRCGPPRTTWSVGPPLTSGGGAVYPTIQYGSVQELQVPDIVHNGALVSSGPSSWIGFGVAGETLPDAPTWYAATWASPGVLELVVDTAAYGLTRGKWNVFIKIDDDPAVPFLLSGVLSIY